MERKNELEELVRYHSQLYYNGVPEITDSEFDELVEELRSLDPDNVVLTEIGAAPSYGKKVPHPVSMGSLEKVNEVDDLKSWWNEVGKTGWADTSTMLVSPKIDGLAVRLRYSDGVLVEAATRGDGQVGQDVTDNVYEIDDIPNRLPEQKFTGEVRGEIYMTFQRWRQLGTYANPRNAAAGSLLQKDPKETGNHGLSFIAYQISKDGDTFKSEWGMASVAGSLGFKYVEMEEVSPDHLDAYLMQWCDKRRHKLDYPIDGLVITHKDLNVQDEMGWNGSTPRGKIAWKFPPQKRETTVRSIDWQVGRTGKVTPVLNIDPVHLDGSEVTRMTLHSTTRFEELGLGESDVVVVEKAGDIIPQVARVKEHSGNQFRLPENCLSCGSELQREGANLWCRNTACPAKLDQRIQHWMQTVGVKGIGPQIILQLRNEGGVSSVSDIYYMNQNDLSRILGSEKIGHKIFDELGAKSIMPLWRFLAALDIPGLGETAAKEIAKTAGSLEDVLDMSLAEMQEIEGIGQITAQSILSDIFDLREEIEELRRVLTIEEPETGGVLEGLSFCLTGTMSRSRNEIASDIEAAGGEVKNSVTKKLSYLVQADPSSTSSKAKKAQQNGVPVIGEDELNEMLKGESNNAED